MLGPIHLLLVELHLLEAEDNDNEFELHIRDVVPDVVTALINFISVLLHLLSVLRHLGLSELFAVVVFVLLHFPLLVLFLSILLLFGRVIRKKCDKPCRHEYCLLLWSYCFSRLFFSDFCNNSKHQSLCTIHVLHAGTKTTSLAEVIS